MATTFVDWIKQCCKAEEGALRKFLKKRLEEKGFTVIEDDYVSPRAAKNPRYKSVHNMLAVRGNPNICFVAHTDICRDHKSDNIYYGEESQAPSNQPRVQPVVKEKEIRIGDKMETRKIIQDKDCKLQVGGDDRLGVAINTWLALNTDMDMALLFTTDEEIGLKSAAAVKFPELKEYELLVEVDRGNHTHQIVNRIHGTKLIGYELEAKLLTICYDIGLPRRLVDGNGTDVVRIKENGFCKNAINMTCGYMDSSGASGDEYIDIQHATESLIFAATILKTYFLENKNLSK